MHRTGSQRAVNTQKALQAARVTRKGSGINKVSLVGALMRCSFDNDDDDDCGN